MINVIAIPSIVIRIALGKNSAVFHASINFIICSYILVISFACYSAYAIMPKIIMSTIILKIIPPFKISYGNANAKKR